MLPEMKPHFAPSDQELVVHRKLLADLAITLPRPLTMLVLGATPELADLGLQHGCRVHVVDSSPSLLKAAEPRRTIADRSAETVHCADWRQITPIQDASVDFVIGDAALNNVAPADQPDVFAELRRVTHRRSLFSLKQIVLPDLLPARYEFDHTLAAFRAGQLSDTEFYTILRFASLSATLLQPDLHLLDSLQVFAAFEDKKNKGILSEAEFGFLNARRRETQHTIFRQSDQRQLFQDHLGDCEILSPHGGCHYNDIFNIFRMTPRP